MRLRPTYTCASSCPLPSESVVAQISSSVFKCEVPFSSAFCTFHSQIFRFDTENCIDIDEAPV
jgi:hypothetical protein